LFGSLSGLLAAKLQTQPVVLCFDDLHWGDESSASALHFVVRSNADRPLFTLLAARADELRDNAAVARALRELRQAHLLEEVRLGPLSREALRELIDSHAPGARGERLSADCGGNPLLAIELARAKRRRQRPTLDEPRRSDSRLRRRRRPARAAVRRESKPNARA
jgi:predicted ATPase